MADFSTRIAALPPEKRELLLQRLNRPQTFQASVVLPVIVPRPQDGHLPFPLTDVQKAYWIGRQDLFELGGYANIFLEYEIAYQLPDLGSSGWRTLMSGLLRTFAGKYLENKVNTFFIGRLNRALSRLIGRHDMLRAIMRPDGQQQILPEVPPYKVGVLDLRGQSAQQVESELKKIRECLRYTKTPIDQWPLFEFSVCLLAGQRLRLLIRVDPLIIDGDSRGNLIRELNQLLLNPEEVLPPLECTYRDYALTWEAFRQSGLYQHSREYWLKQLPTLPPAPRLPRIQNASALTSSRFEFLSRELLGPEAWQRLKDRAARAGLSPSGVALAAFVEVLAAWSAEPRFTFGLIGTYHPPLHPQIEDVFGNFNTISLLAVEDWSGTFETRAKRLWTRLMADLDHPYFSGHQVLQELNRQAGGTSSATIPIFFNSVIEESQPNHPVRRHAAVQEGEMKESSLYQLKTLEIGAYIPQVLMMSVLHEDPSGALSCKWQTTEGFFPPGMISDMLSAYGYLLQQLADDEKTWQATSLPLLPSEEPLAARTASLAADTSGDQLEVRLTQLWGQLLGPHQIGSKDNFFERGGNSFLLARLFAQLRTEFGLEHALPAFLNEPTIATLARVIRQRADFSKTRVVGEQPSHSSHTEKKEATMTQPGLNRKFSTFVAIWLGHVISVFGSALTSFALGVWVYQRTSSATQFALIAMFAVLPGILISPFAGVLVDRWDRRRVLIFSDILSACVTLGLIGLLLTNRLEIWLIYLGAIINSISSSLFQPALSASTTLLVDQRDYGRANGMIQLGFGTAQIVAPAVAGALVVVLEVWRLLFIDFMTFLIAIAILFVMRIPRASATTESPGAQNSLLRQATFGWTYIRARRGLLGLLIFFAISNFALGIVQVLITPLVLSFANADVLGQVLAIGGIGVLLGGLTMSLWGGPKRRVPGILSFVLLQGLILLLGGAQPNAWLVAIAAIVFLFSAQIIGASSQAIWQSKVAPEVQGRVFAFRTMIAWSSLPLAYVIAGPLADNVFGPLLAAGGPLASNLGLLIGTGPGRGIGLLYIVLGIVLILTATSGYFYSPLRRVESELPDVLTERERAAVLTKNKLEKEEPAHMPAA